MNEWSRKMGVSVRPWSGRSPSWLIFRGLIQGALCILFAVIALRLALGDFGANVDELKVIRNVAIPGAIIAGIFLVLAVIRIVVGIIDALSRRQVHGQIVSLLDRRTGDFLPGFVQTQIFTRNNHGYDKRRHRVEIVVLTSEGERQWTVRNRRVESVLEQGYPGANVLLTVTPIAGYVSEAQVS